MSDTVVRFSRADLGELTKIGSGGQGTVYNAPRLRINHAAAAVYKEYHPDILAGMDLDQLEAMVEFAAALDPARQAQLFSLCAWPMALVTDDTANVAGIAMPRVPERFFIELRLSAGTKQSLAALQHLLNTQDWLARRGIPINDHLRLQLLAAAADALQFLHAHGITVGDLSAKNLLFSLTGQPACYFIDCDAMALNGRSIMQQLETPDWDIRTISPEPLATTHTDTYKLALAALRLFANDQTARHARHAAAMPAPVRDIITKALDTNPTNRPTLDTWPPTINATLTWASTKLPELAELPKRKPPQPAARVVPHRWPTSTTSPAQQSTPAAPTSTSPAAAAAVGSASPPGPPSSPPVVVAPSQGDQLSTALGMGGFLLSSLAVVLAFLTGSTTSRDKLLSPAVITLSVVLAGSCALIGVVSALTDSWRVWRRRLPHAGTMRRWQWVVTGSTMAVTTVLLFGGRTIDLPIFAWDHSDSGTNPAASTWIGVFVPPVMVHLATMLCRLKEP